MIRKNPGRRICAAVNPARPRKKLRISGWESENDEDNDTDDGVASFFDAGVGERVAI